MYLVFAFEHYYPQGGWYDYATTLDKVEDISKYLVIYKHPKTVSICLKLNNKVISFESLQVINIDTKEDVFENIDLIKLFKEQPNHYLFANAEVM